MRHATNPELVNLIGMLKKESRESGTGVWRDLAEYLSRSRRRRITVNVSRLNRHTKRGETVVVPGKVLGAGSISHSIHVAAFAFSEEARSKILKAKGRCLSLPQLMKNPPQGSNVKIIR